MVKAVSFPTGVYNTGKATLMLDNECPPAAVNCYPNGTTYLLEVVYFDKTKFVYGGNKASMMKAYDEINDFITSATKESE